MSEVKKEENDISNNSSDKKEQELPNKEEVSNQQNQQEVKQKKRRPGDQFLFNRVDVENIDVKTMTEEQKADLKAKLEEECLKVCNGYAQELAFAHQWDSFDNIKMANDRDLDDLYDENNQKLKTKLKIIAGWIFGFAISYITNISWLFLVFWVGSILPHVWDLIINKEQYDSYIVPNIDAYFSQSYVSFGFKRTQKGRGRVKEQDKSLHPKALELYDYYKETLLLIRSLRPSKDEKKKK
ncbi:transmembrane protein, putative (macronuclear) [Tetrahymena thermophila SB210]|uniref:Transmembrane protein, putative n=1 Tax=Tetrahymena thermophila (strain SB210) TaxID=312017 RepID=I7MHG5_TETTS|nr:transmembrane protein, putative [Tetrahymena thermophila SB210]EAS02954.1 transmembrane protein, putative [Tetrahymena thermophila SB210]|eukprot:XP_001023199.1 transmembrane protein, putative [Tetrahymena thermophila SB210]